MMSNAQIVQMSRDAAMRAAEESKVPLMVWPEDLVDLSLIRGIPFLGDYVPRGWKRVGVPEGRCVYKHDGVSCWFVDSSGFGADDEPALSIEQFLGCLEAGFGYAIVEAGQFQVHVAKYVKGR